MFELEKQIYKRQQINVFEEMLSTATISKNPIALIIWIGLAFWSLTIFVLFSIALNHYHGRYKDANVEHEPQQPNNPEMPPNSRFPKIFSKS